MTNRVASGFRVCYSDGLDAAVFSTASAELCVNKLKRWTSPMMSGPHRYLSRILEVCWDINETFMTENFGFYWCPVKTRSLFFLRLSHSENLLLSLLWSWRPPAGFSLSICLFPIHTSLMTSAVVHTVLSLFLCCLNISPLLFEIAGEIAWQSNCFSVRWYDLPPLPVRIKYSATNLRCM